MSNLKLKKMSQAFQLDPMPEAVTIAYSKKDKKWYPIDSHYIDKGKVYIYGQGWIKVDKWEQKTIQPLSNPYTAKEIKVVYDQYGYNVAMGMVQGWCNQSLFTDQSCGLSYTKYEIANMGTLGKAYDEYTDLVQEIGDKFIQNLLKKRFTIHGTIEKGGLWHDYKNKNDCGELIGSVGIYETIHLHPLQHVEHNIGMSFMASRILPSFNPITFDDMLVTIFIKIYKNHRAMLDKYVSVHDRIQHLTTKKIADSFEQIFEMEKELKVDKVDKVIDNAA